MLKDREINQSVERLADGLAERGWAVIPGFFPREMTESLYSDLQGLEAAHALKAASIGREGGKKRDESVRNDRTLWLDGESPAQAAYLSLMDNVREGLNRALYLGLFEYEAHYALYEAGGFYKKHIDSLAGTRNRIISCVTYLTPDWQEKDEGWLALYDPQDHDKEVSRILPACGTLAVFMSETMPHEVLPPRRTRASIAGWFRCNPSASTHVNPL